MKISIIIPFKQADVKSSQRVSLVIKSLVNSTSKNDEIILVTDKKCDFSLPVNIKEIQFQGSRAKSRNYAIKHAKNNYIMLLDSDTLVSKESVNILKDALMKFDYVFGAYRRSIPYQSQDEELAKHVLKENWKFAHLQSKLYTTNIYDQGILGNFSYIANFGGIKKDVLRKVGGFDENLSLWGAEDTELMIKLHNKNFVGYQLYKVGLIAYHLEHYILPNRNATLTENLKYIGSKYNLNRYDLSGEMFKIFDLRHNLFSPSTISTGSETNNMTKKLLKFTEKLKRSTKLEVLAQINKHIKNYNTTSIFLDGSILSNSNYTIEDLDFRIITNDSESKFVSHQITDDLRIELTFVSMRQIIDYYKSYWKIPNTVLWELGGFKHSELIFDRMNIGYNLKKVCHNLPIGMRLFLVTYSIGGVDHLVSKLRRKRVLPENCVLDIKRYLWILTAACQSLLPDAYWVLDNEIPSYALDMFHKVVSTLTLNSIVKFLKNHIDLIRKIDTHDKLEYIIYFQNKEGLRFITKYKKVLWS